MKTKIMLPGICIAFALIGFGIAACHNTANPEAELVSIEVTTKSTKANYIIGQAFDPTDIVVTAHYSDGSTLEITVLVYL